MQLKALGQDELIKRQRKLPAPQEPPKKQFKPKYIKTRLADYSKPAPPEFWSDWPTVTWEQAQAMKATIDVVKFREMATATEYPDLYLLNTVCEYLEKGAKLEVAENCKVPSTSNNAVSAFECGEQVMDALYGWVKSGIAMGPMKKDDIPFNHTKISGLMCKLKSNGTARIII